MAGNDSPFEKMSLRKKIKPPKPFSGDVMDDLLSSIQGDRAIDSFDMDQLESPAVQMNGRSLVQRTSSEKVAQKKTRKRASSAGEIRTPKTPRITKESSPEHVSRGRTMTRPDVWRPGAGMTPANNKRCVLDLQTLSLLRHSKLDGIEIVHSMFLEVEWIADYVLQISRTTDGIQPKPSTCQISNIHVRSIPRRQNSWAKLYS